MSQPTHRPDADAAAAAPQVPTTGVVEAPEITKGPGRAWTRGRSAGTALALLVAGFLLVKGADDPRRFAVVTLNGVTLAALFFVVASGFTLIFGLMRVVNMAHGSLYLLGGYIALELQEAWFKDDAGLGLSL